MKKKQFDRTIEDVGNIIGLEHLNLTVPSQELATVFYVSGLGLTQDPFISVGRENMWANIGNQQFHLPTRPPQILRGSIGLVFPDLETLQQRLELVKEPLSETEFDFTVHKQHISVTGPWGNSFECHQSLDQSGQQQLGIQCVNFVVPEGTASGIAKFYETAMLAPTKLSTLNRSLKATVSVGVNQWFTFQEKPGIQPAYDGHHIAIYLANFSRPHSFLKERGLITEETNEHQYRFVDIIDPDTSELLFKIEHEVRSLRHPMHGRTLINRNANQNLRAYVQGKDHF